MDNACKNRPPFCVAILYDRKLYKLFRNHRSQSRAPAHFLHGYRNLASPYRFLGLDRLPALCLPCQNTNRAHESLIFRPRNYSRYSFREEAAERRALPAGCRVAFGRRLIRGNQSGGGNFGQTQDGRTALWASLNYATKRLSFHCFACCDWKYFTRAIWHRINTEAKTRTAVLEMGNYTLSTNTIIFHVLPNG